MTRVNLLLRRTKKQGTWMHRYHHYWKSFLGNTSVFHKLADTTDKFIKLLSLKLFLPMCICTHIFMYIYIYMCVCVCVCMCILFMKLVRMCICCSVFVLKFCVRLHCVKLSLFGVFCPVYSRILTEYGTEKFRIRTLFTQCCCNDIFSFRMFS